MKNSSSKNKKEAYIKISFFFYIQFFVDKQKRVSKFSIKILKVRKEKIWFDVEEIRKWKIEKKF